MPPQIIFGDVGQLDPEDLKHALKENSIQRMDTAARYGGGQSEVTIGNSGLSQDVVIDTKILFKSQSEPFLTPETISTSLDHSLAVLRVPKVNTLYAHAQDFLTPIEVQAKAFDEQYRKGKFVHLGVSNLTPEAVQEWIDIADKEGYVKPTVYQGQYNLLCRGHEETLFPLLRRNNMVFTAYSPLAGGFLLGNFTSDGIQGGKRFQREDVPFRKWYDHASMHEAIKKLKAISEKTGLGMDELSLRWLRYHSLLGDQDVIINGASKISQIGASVGKARKGPLPDDVAKELSDLWEGVKADGREITDFSKEIPDTVKKT